MVGLKKQIIRENGMLFFTIVLFLLFSIFIPSFLSSKNMNVIAVGRVPVGMFAIAALIPLVVGEFDISLPNMIGLLMMIGGKTAVLGAGSLEVVVVVLTASIFLGAVNGLIAVYFRISSTISTLATGMIMYGASLAINGGKALTSVVPKILLWFGKIRIFHFNISIWIFFLVAVASYYILEQTPFGKYVYEIGYSEKVVSLAGVNTKLVRFLSFIFASTVIGLCAVILLTRSRNVYPDTNSAYLLAGLAITFLSMAMHTPGRFNIPGVVVGTMLLGFVFNALGILGAPFWAEAVINGGVLLIVVVLAGLDRR